MQNTRTRYSVIPSKLLGVSCMLLMIQAYGFAPLQPTLTLTFASPWVTMAVPAFAFSFALSAGGMVWLHKYLNLQQCFQVSLYTLCLGSLLLSFSNSVETFLLTRTITGLGTGLMLPSALMLATRTGTKKAAFVNLIMIMFALGTGMTIGPSVGGWMNELCGWRILYQVMGVLAAALIFSYYLTRHHAGWNTNAVSPAYTVNHSQLLWRSRYIYAFVYLTGVFHSGVFVWISIYFARQYQLGQFGIANDLMLFGLPGLTMTFLMFRYRLDTKVLPILYIGLALTIGGLLILNTSLPLWLAECLLVIMSLGFSFSQPIFIGIMRLPSTVRPVAAGCAVLFSGYGSGPLLISFLTEADGELTTAFLIILVVCLILLSRRIWRLTSRRYIRSHRSASGLYAHQPWKQAVQK